MADLPAAVLGQDGMASCDLCRGCAWCDETYCPFHAQGDPERCIPQRCMYCVDYIKRQRLFLNNVG